MTDPRKLSATKVGMGPLYRQIASEIWEQIQDGRLQPGQRLPSEPQLSEQYGVNRLTVRQAVIELQRLGALEIRRGSGTFVTIPPDLVEIVATVPPREQTGDSTQAAFAQPRVEEDRAVGGLNNPLPTRPLRQVEERIEYEGPAVGGMSGAAAGHLGLEAGELLRLDTVMIQSVSAWIVNTYWYPSHFAELKELLGEHGTVVSALREGLGLDLSYRWRAFSAAAADYDEARLLDIPTGTALLVRDGVTTTADGESVFYVRRRIRGDAAKFVLRYSG